MSHPLDDDSSTPSPPTPRVELPTDAENRTPRFGILHLMLLTASCSLLLVPSRMMVTQDYGIANNLRFFIIGQWLAHIAFHAAPLTALLMWLPCRLRGDRFPVAPGHWILITMGVGAVTSVLHSMLWVVLRLQDIDWASSAETSVYFAVCLVIGMFRLAATAAIAIFGVRESRWRLGFLAISLVELSAIVSFAASLLAIRNAGPPSTLYLVSRYIYSGAQLGSFCTVVTLAVLDWRGAQRDWLHWLGIFCYLLSGLAQTALALVFQFWLF